MYLSLIAISFFLTIGLILFFRRLDRPKTQTARLERLSSNHGDELKKLSTSYLQKIKDASLDFDVKYRQSHQVQAELQKQLESFSEQLNQVKNDQSIVDEMTKNFQSIAQKANHVSTQIEHLDRGLERLAYAEEEINSIKGKIIKIDENLLQNQEQSQNKLSEVVSRLIQETEDQNRQLAENMRNSYMSLHNDSMQLESEIAANISQNEKINERISSLSREMDSKWEIEINKLDQKFIIQEGKLKERTSSIEKGLSGIRNTAVKALEDDLAHMKKEMQDITLEVMARRDETLHDTKNMASDLHSQMQIFEENYLSAESKLLRDAKSISSELEEKLAQIHNEHTIEQNRKTELLDEQILALHQQLNDIRDEKLTRLQDTIESELGNAKIQLEEKRQAEEDKLKFIQDDVSQLQENLGYLSRELKAELRNESQSACSELKSLQEENLGQLTNLKSETHAAMEEMDSLYKHANNEFIATRDGCLKTLERTSIEIIDTIDAKNSDILKDMSTLQENMQYEIQNTYDSLHSSMELSAQRVQQDIQNVSTDINEQVEKFRLDHSVAKDLVASVEHTSNELTSSFRSELKTMGRQFHGELNQLLDRYHSEMELQKNKIEKDLTQKALKLEQSTDKIIDNITQTANTKTQQFNDHLETYTNEFNEHIESHTSEFNDHFEKQKNNFNSHLSTQTDEYNNRLDNQLNDFSSSIENQSNQKIIEFENKAIDIENRSEQKVEIIHNQIEGMLLEARHQKDELLNNIKAESEVLEEFRDKITLVDKSSEYIQKLEETLEVIEDRLTLAREEKDGLGEFTEDLLNLRQTRKELESEVRLIETQRSRLNEAEKHFQRIEERLTEVDTKFSNIGAAEELAKVIEKRVVQFQEFKDSFEKFYGEIGDRREFIESSITYIKNIKDEIQLSQNQNDGAQEGFEKLKLRQENLTDILKDLESRTSALRSFEGDVQRVESRFEQIEDLMHDLSNKQKQVGAMSRKIEQMQSGGTELKEELDSLVSEADEKMDRLSAFYQLVDQLLDQSGNYDTLSTTQKSKGKYNSRTANLPEHKVNGILSLHMNHKWDADLIADRMNVEPAIVRAVISSHTK